MDPAGQGDGEKDQESRDRQEAAGHSPQNRNERQAGGHVPTSDHRRLRPADREGPLADHRVPGTVRDLVDVQDQRHEQRHRHGSERRFPAEGAAGLDSIGPEQHHRPESDRGGDLAEAAIDELDRRHRVEDADEEADRGDGHEGRRASHRQERKTEQRRHAVARGREQAHVPHGEQTVLDDPAAAAELRGSGVGVIGALESVEDVVRDVEAEVDEGGGHDRYRGGREVEEARSGGDGDPQQHRRESRRQERQSSGPEEEPAGRELWAHGAATFRGELRVVGAGPGQAGFVGHRQGQACLVPGPRAIRLDRERATRRATPRATPRGRGHAPRRHVAAGGRRAIGAGAKRGTCHGDDGAGGDGGAGRRRDVDAPALFGEGRGHGRGERVALPVDPGQDRRRAGGELREILRHFR